MRIPAHTDRCLETLARTFRLPALHPFFSSITIPTQESGQSLDSLPIGLSPGLPRGNEHIHVAQWFPNFL